MFVKENYQSRNRIHLLHLCFTQFWKAFFTFHFGGTTVRSPSFVCYQQLFIEIEVYDISRQNDPHLNDHHLLESCFFLQGTLCPLLWQEIFMRTLERKTWKKKSPFLFPAKKKTAVGFFQEGLISSFSSKIEIMQERRQPCVICYQSNVHFLLKCTPSNMLLLLMAASSSSRLHLFSLIS